MVRGSPLLAREGVRGEITRSTITKSVPLTVDMGRAPGKWANVPIHDGRLTRLAAVGFLMRRTAARRLTHKGMRWLTRPHSP